MGEVMALFGGTFDPVHFGHLITARAVAEQCGFERITLVPAASAPHKERARTSAEHRLSMLRLAIGDDPMFDICTLELSRGGPSYTYDTLVALRDLYGQDAKLNWIIGADMLEDLGSWRRIDDLLGIAHLVVACRPPWSERVEELLEGLKGHLPAESLTRIHQAIVPTPLLDISSSDIRSRVVNRRSIRYLTPEVVRCYIDERGLYR